MSKKTPQTATGGKRKRSPGDKTDPQHKKGEQADLETQGNEESDGKKKKSNEVTIYSRTSTQPLPHASAICQFHEEGKFNKPWQKGLI